MSIITADEIFGISEGRVTSFAVTDDESRAPAGIMSVRILPEYIRLERIYILPEFRRRGYASGLLEIIKDRPEAAWLPINAFLEDGENEDVRELLEASGFTGRESGFSVITGHLKDLIDTDSRLENAVPEAVRRKVKLYRLNMVPKHMIRNFINASPHDELLQFPDKASDLERFSDISMICLMGNTVRAASMIEEAEEHTQFTWCYGDEPIAVLACINAAKKELGEEYGPDHRIRCLCREESMEQRYKNLFTEYERKTINMFCI